VNEIKFMLTGKQYIHLVPDPICEGCCEVCSRSNVYYIDEELGLNILFGYTESDSFHGSFPCKSIESLLNNKLFFDNSRRRDPGFESCQYFEGLIEDSDVIEKYHFIDNNPAGISPKYSSWFYNDKDGNIIFEISPTYEFYKMENLIIMADENAQGFIPYEVFIQNYKVVVHKIIPKKILVQWNEQTKNYRHVFEKLDHSIEQEQK